MEGGGREGQEGEEERREGGSLKVVKWLWEKGWAWEEEAAHMAARRGLFSLEEGWTKWGSEFAE
jgi:hypothetical protein